MGYGPWDWNLSAGHQSSNASLPLFELTVFTSSRFYQVGEDDPISSDFKYSLIVKINFD